MLLRGKGCYQVAMPLFLYRRQNFQVACNTKSSFKQITVCIQQNFLFPRNGTYCSVSSKHQPLSSYRVLVLKIGCCFNAKEPVSMHLRFFLFSSAAMTPVEYRELEYGRVTWGRGRRLRTRGRGSAKTKPVLYTQIILMAYFL